MSVDLEAIFDNWSKGPGDTEQERIENTEKQIRLAIAACPKLNYRNVVVFTQGSYRNRVNVKKDSDVDIGILCYDIYYPDYSDNNIKAILENSTSQASYTYSDFKNEIEEALIAKFGKASVKRGNKSFDIKENSYRVDADVTAFVEHRLYTNVNNYLSGVQMFPDNYIPTKIVNWPEQHYTNGVNKNDLTYRRYKRIVRILKNLSNNMSDNGNVSAKQMPSFLIECLIWNVPNEYFIDTNFTYTSAVRKVLAYLFNNTMKDEQCSEWGEVSMLKYLFHNSQPWTRQQAHQFISDAWNYLGYK